MSDRVGGEQGPTTEMTPLLTPRGYTKVNVLVM